MRDGDGTVGAQGPGSDGDASPTVAASVSAFVAPPRPRRGASTAAGRSFGLGGIGADIVLSSTAGALRFAHTDAGVRQALANTGVLLAHGFANGIAYRLRLTTLCHSDHHPRPDLSGWIRLGGIKRHIRGERGGEFVAVELLPVPVDVDVNPSSVTSRAASSRRRRRDRTERPATMPPYRRPR